MLRIGPRLWKTGLAVAVAVSVIRLLGTGYEVFGALAAVLAVAPSTGHSLRTTLELIGINLLGGLIGTAAVVLLGPHPVVIGAVVVAVLLLCQQMRWQRVSGAAVTVALFVMAPHAEAAHEYVLHRLLSVLVGSVVGTLVNALVARPDYLPATVDAIRRAGVEVDRFVLLVAERLPRPDGLTKAEVLAGAARVESRIAEARQLCAVLAESRWLGANREREVLERAVKVLASLLERIQIVHKAALAAQKAPDYAAELPAIQEGLAVVLRHRRALYLELLGRTAGEDGTLPAALLEIEQRFESAIRLPERPEEAEVYFRLYRMRSSVSYMANRLGRLHAAMQGGAARESFPLSTERIQATGGRS